MTEPSQRLREARVRAGFETAKDAALFLGVPVSTYLAHENGSRGIPASRAPHYARRFKVTEEWLLFGRGEEHSDKNAEVLDLFARLPSDRKEEALAILRVLSGT